MTPEVTPTNEQIKAEARRRLSRASTGTTFSDKVIEVMREGWTPPVDPDLLAWRKYFAKRSPLLRDEIMKGEWDSSADAYLAGARMARERAGAAASEARIKELEEAIRDVNKRLKDYTDMTVDQWDETVADGGITAWMVIRQELQTVVAGGLARALLKEADQ